MENFPMRPQILLPLPTQNSSDSKRVSFNEAELAEHDKDRGTRMVIPDPDTPFMRSPVVSDDESDSPQFLRRVDVHTMMAEAVTANTGSQSDEEQRHREFAARRKNHYNEFRVLKGQGHSPGNDGSDATDPRSV